MKGLHRMLVLALAACGKPQSAAPEGALPADRYAVGPMPGVGERSPEPNPLGDDRNVLQEGRRWFVLYNCSGCHGGRAGGGMGPSLRDEIWLYGSTPDRIFSSIAQGRGHGMPSWGTRIPQRHVWAMVAYIQSLRTRDEPEAPR
jgi:cytochrome c oxidase cbb3-type subunit III